MIRPFAMLFVLSAAPVFAEVVPPPVKVEKPLQVISELVAGRVVSGLLAVNRTATYRLRLRSGQRVEIDSLSNKIDTRLTLRDVANQVIAINLDGGNNRNAKLHVQAPLSRAINHTYFIEVGNDSKQTGNYELLVRERTATPPSAPLTITRGQEVRGQLGPESAILSGDGHPYAAHQFEGKAGTRVRISLVAKEFDPKVYLRRSGAAIAENDDGGVGNASQLVYRLEKDGTYEIWASAIETLKTPSEYQLALVELPEPALVPTSETIVWGQVLPGKVGDGDAVLKRLDLGGGTIARVLARTADGCPLSSGERPYRFYRLAGVAGQRARITLKGAGGTTERCQLLIEVGAMTAAGFAWVSQRSLVPAARIVFETAGEMLIRISVASGDNVAYTLLVENDATPAPEPAPTPAIPVAATSGQ